MLRIPLQVKMAGEMQNGPSHGDLLLTTQVDPHVEPPERTIMQRLVRSLKPSCRAHARVLGRLQRLLTNKGFDVAQFAHDGGFKVSLACRPLALCHHWLAVATLSQMSAGTRVQDHDGPAIRKTYITWCVHAAEPAQAYSGRGARFSCHGLQRVPGTPA